MRQKTRNKRNEFLKVGKELFFEKGYINVTVKEICDILETTTGSFYFMFSSKEKLLEELLLEDLTKLWSIGDKAINTKKDLNGRLNEFFDNSLDFIVKEIEVMGFYDNLLGENGIGGKTANQIKAISVRKQEETLYNLLVQFKEDLLHHDHKRLKDLAKYTVLILDNKHSEVIKKAKNNININSAKEADFLTKAIEGLIRA